MSNITLNDFLNLIGGNHIYNGDNVYVDDPLSDAKAKDKKAVISYHKGSYYFHSFKKDEHHSYKSLKERLNGYSPKPSLNLTPKNTEKELLPIEHLLLKSILKKALELLPQTDYHLSKFKHKRKFDMPSNYRSYDQSVINQLKELFGRELIERIFPWSYRDRVIIFYLMPDGTPGTIRAYSFTKTPKKLSPDRSIGLPQLPYGLQNLSKPFHSVIITEGEEKADCLNLLLPPGYIALGIPGISNQSVLDNYLKYFKGKKVYILFDRRNPDFYPDDKKYIEQKAEVKLLNKLAGIKSVKVMELPLPEEKEHDFDEYINLFLTRSEQKTEFRRLEKTSLTRKRYKRKYEKLIPKSFSELTESIEPKNKWKKLPSLLELEKDLLEVRTEFKEKLEKLKEGILHVILPPGSGKTTIINNRVKELVRKGKRILYLVPTKELINQLIKNFPDMDDRIEILTGIVDNCLEHNLFMMENNALTAGYYSPDKENLEDQFKLVRTIKKILATENNQKDLCKNCPIAYKAGKQCQQQKQFKGTIPAGKNIFIATHAKASLSLDNMIKRINPDLIVIDENILSSLIKELKITLKDISNTLPTNENQKNILEALTQLMKIKKELTGKDIIKELENIFPDFHQNIKEIKLSDIDNPDIDLEAENIPLNFLEKLFRALKTNPERMVLKLQASSPILTITEKLDFNLGNIPTIVLDGTGSTELLKLALGRDDITEYSPRIKKPGLTINQCFTNTFSKSGLTGNETLNERFINWCIEKINNTDGSILFLGSKEQIEFYREKLPADKVKFVAYQSILAKGINDPEMASCKVVIALPPVIHPDSLNNLAIALRPGEPIKPGEIARYNPTGFIKDGKQLFCKENLPADDFIYQLQQYKLISELLQAIFRAYRDYSPDNKTEVYIFGREINTLAFGLKVDNEFFLDKPEINQADKNQSWIFELINNHFGFIPSFRSDFWEKHEKELQTLVNTNRVNFNYGVHDEIDTKNQPQTNDLSGLDTNVTDCTNHVPQNIETLVNTNRVNFLLYIYRVVFGTEPEKINKLTIIRQLEKLLIQNGFIKYQIKKPKTKLNIFGKNPECINQANELFFPVKDILPGTPKPESNIPDFQEITAKSDTIKKDFQEITTKFHTIKKDIEPDTPNILDLTPVNDLSGLITLEPENNPVRIKNLEPNKELTEMIELEPEINLLYENYVMGNYEKLSDIVFRYREKLVNRPEKINPEKFLTDLENWVNQVPISSPSYFNRMFVLDHFSDLMELEALNQDIELQRLRLEMIYQFGNEVNHPVEDPDPVKMLMPTIKPKPLNHIELMNQFHKNPVPIEVINLECKTVVKEFLTYLWFGSINPGKEYLDYVLNNLKNLSEQLTFITKDLLSGKHYSGENFLITQVNRKTPEGYENKLLLDYQLYLEVRKEKPHYTNPSAIGFISDIKKDILIENIKEIVTV